MSVNPGLREGPRRMTRAAQPAVHRQETGKDATIDHRTKSRRPAPELVRQCCGLKVRDKSGQTPVMEPSRSTKPRADLPYAPVLLPLPLGLSLLAGRRHQNISSSISPDHLV